MPKLNQKQLDTKSKIESISSIIGIDPTWATSIAMVESSLGLNQLSRTGCKGVFQMSLIAMKDLLLSMSDSDDDLVDIICGMLFLRLLLKRFGSIDEATLHFCDPKDKSFYLNRVQQYMKEFK
jgi:hypothetical protein